MPAYLFTFHSFRSWNADHPRGFVQRGHGIQPPNAALARFYDRVSKQAPVQLHDRHQRTIVWIAWDACRIRGWRLHGVAFEPSHVHLMVSWRSADSWCVVRGKLKNLVSWSLSREFGQPGRRWLVRGASRKRIRDRKHFEHLIAAYLSGHGGLFWKEGEPVPAAPAWAQELEPRGEPPSPDGG